jgi:hypothetical protein
MLCFLSNFSNCKFSEFLLIRIFILYLKRLLYSVHGFLMTSYFHIFLPDFSGFLPHISRGFSVIFDVLRALLSLQNPPKLRSGSEFSKSGSETLAIENFIISLF